MSLRRPSIRRAKEVSDHRILERRPGVVIYRENAFWSASSKANRVSYVFLAGNDVRDEAERILKQRTDKFSDYDSGGVASFEPRYLHLLGSSDYNHWTEDEARANLEGYLRLQDLEDELIEDHVEATMRWWRKGKRPPGNIAPGRGGRNPRWVDDWLERLGYDHLRDFRSEIG